MSYNDVHLFIRYNDLQNWLLVQSMKLPTASPTTTLGAFDTPQYGLVPESHSRGETQASSPENRASSRRHHPRPRAGEPGADFTLLGV